MMKISLAVLPFFFIMFSVGFAALHEGSLALQIIGFVFVAAVICSSLIWCLLDSVVNDYPFGKYMLGLFVLALPLGIVIYLYRSRGFKNGSIALIKVAAFVAVILFLSGVSGVVTSRILKISIKNASRQCSRR